VELGKAYGEYPIVREFVRLPGLGHCPQDEGPDVVNPLIERMVDMLEAERRQQR
jgi:pimeloyl-ACP methyl ester carboxylesterase